MKILSSIDIGAFHFRKQGKGGMYPTPHPDGTFPADAEFISFDPETLTVTYKTPNGEDEEGNQLWTESEKVFTEAEVEAAKEWKAPLNLNAVLSDLRKKRNELLAESDFSQLSDAPVDSAAWAVYRQQLRDLPSTVDPVTGQYTWPAKPNA